jgi:hypothetical protein
MITIKLTPFEADAVENALRSYIPLASSRGQDVHHPVEALVRLMKSRWGIGEEAEQASALPYVSKEQSDMIVSLVKSGLRVQAVKKYREWTNCGLKTAVDTFKRAGLWGG